MDVPTHPAHDHALHMLKEQDREASEVIRVEPDSILYLDLLGRPMTAWMRIVGERTVMAFDCGFPAEPEYCRFPEVEEDSE